MIVGSQRWQSPCGQRACGGLAVWLMGPGAATGISAYESGRLCASSRRGGLGAPIQCSDRWRRAMTDSDENTSIVFIVDDQADVRDGLKAFFEAVDLRVMTFASTLEFLRHQHQDEPSCLILDV